MRVLRWLLRGTGILAGIGLLLFALVQTPVGQSWLAGAISRASRGPGFALSIAGLHGFVPFRIGAARIDIADRNGTWLTLRDVRLVVAPADLLAGRVRVRLLRARAVRMIRPPAMSGASSGMPRLPLPASLDRLSADRIELAATVLGEPVAATLHGTARLAGGVLRARLDLHRIDGAAGSLAVDLRLAGAGLSLTAEAREPTGLLLDDLLHRQDRPPLTLTLRGAGPLSDWHGRLHAAAGTIAAVDADLHLAADAVTASGTLAVAKLLPPPLAPLLGADAPFALRASFGRKPALDRLVVHAAAGELTGRAEFGGGVAAHLRLDLPSLTPVAAAFGRRLDGAAEAAAVIAAANPARVSVRFSASADRVRTGIAAADAVLGGELALTGRAERDAAGNIAFADLTATGGDVSLAGSGRFDPVAGRLDGAFDIAVPQLQPLDRRLAGRLAAHLHLSGPIDRLRLDGTIDGSGIAAGGVTIARLSLDTAVADLAAPDAVIDGSFRIAGRDATLALEAMPQGGRLVVPRLRLSSGDAVVDGRLRVAFDSGLVGGQVAARLPDLARWSPLAGVALRGGLDAKLDLAATAGQAARLTATGIGIGIGGVEIGRLGLDARVADLLRAPAASGRLTASAARVAGGSFGTAALVFDMKRPGRFAFRGDAEGAPLTIAFAGDGTVAPGAAELRLARLSGTLGSDKIVLRAPLTVTRRGGDIAFSGLSLGFGSGRITGSGALRGGAIAARLAVADVGLAGPAHLAGYREIGGTLTARLDLGGSLAAPRGHVSIAARGLRVAAARQSHVPLLGLDLAGEWNGRTIAVNGRVTGLKSDTIGFDGSLPLVLTQTPFALALRPESRLALRLHGSGQLADIADLLPLGEDRLTGRFAIAAAAGGTPAAPTASGRLNLTDGRFEDFATGMILSGITAEIAGDRGRLTLAAFSAGDGAKGTLTATGSLALAGMTADLKAKLSGFRIAARDEAVATASGDIAVSGRLAAPKVVANLTVDRADLRLPSRLPPQVARLDVTYTGGKPGAPPPRSGGPPALPATLDIRLDLPGRVFVRGKGLDSEWRGRLGIAGTSAAPRITGSLEAIRGTFDLLGKTFRLSHGRIGFGGSVDPTLDILAEVAAADVTAQARITGLASAPAIKLGSTPPLPQEEVLSRVLFGQGVGQITAGEGLQLADAAAALASGGPGVLDRLRGTLGLDRLGFGSTQNQAGVLNPAAAAASATGGAGATGISGGKYVAEGVYVGVAQGLAPASSRVKVEIELRPHLTVDTEVGQANDSGIGLNWKYDY